MYLIKGTYTYFPLKYRVAYTISITAHESISNTEQGLRQIERVAGRSWEFGTYSTAHFPVITKAHAEIQIAARSLS